MRVEIVEDSGTRTMEDFVFHAVFGEDIEIAAVFDGRSVLGEKQNGPPGNLRDGIKELNLESSGQFAAHVVEQAISAALSLGETDPCQLIGIANSFLEARLIHHRLDIASPQTLPGGAILVVRINLQLRKLEFAYLADCHLAIFDPHGHAQRLTVDHMLPLDEACDRTARDNIRILTERDHTIDFQTARYGETIYAVCGIAHGLTNPVEQDRGHRAIENSDLKHGLGVLNGMSSAMEYVQTGSVRLGSYTHVLACTDGLPFNDRTSFESEAQFLLASHTLQELADKKRRRDKEAGGRHGYNISGILLKV